MKIELTNGELYQGVMVGIGRRLNGIRRNGPSKAISDRGHWEISIQGALAELAFAKLCNVHWAGALEDEPHKRPDVGGYQVRQIGHPRHNLICRESDFEHCLDHPFLLMQGTDKSFNVIGWEWGREIMTDEFWTVPPAIPVAGWRYPRERLRTFVRPALETTKEATGR